MWTLVAGAVVAGSPLVVGELVSRIFRFRSEYARKTVHIFGSLAAASLVLFLELPEIFILGLIFCLILPIIRHYKLVSALYQVDRHSHGELYFPAGVAAAAAIAPNNLAYVLAILILGFSDTVASLIGRTWGSYQIKFAHHKSLQGSLAFLVMTCILLGAFSGFGLAQIACVTLATTLAELLSSRGTDNLTIPAAASLSMLAFSI